MMDKETNNEKDPNNDKLASYVHDSAEKVETYVHVSTTGSGQQIVQKKRKPTATFFRMQAFLRKKDKPPTDANNSRGALP